MLGGRASFSVRSLLSASPVAQFGSLARTMEVELHANICDWTTRQIAHALRAPFKAISKDLSKEYGGTIQHLWIDFDLHSVGAQQKPHSFRFQKKVGGTSPDRFTGLPRQVYENVGHYSVRPDFRELRRVPLETVASYVLSLVYASTSVLIEKQKKLGGFDAEKFRSEFVAVCRQHGYQVTVPAGAR
jgi:hypothetical protein